MTLRNHLGGTLYYATGSSWVREGSGAPPVGYGAPTIGTASYSVPAGAKYVGSAPLGTANSGSGTIGSPFIGDGSINAAITASASGGTVVLRAGDYRQSINTSKSITIQNAAGEAVWLVGSRPVTSWASDPSGAFRSDNWTYQFDHTSVGAAPGDANLANYPDQVFIDGAPQTQVGSLSAVGPGAFFVDYTQAKLYIGSNPAGKTVEASFLSTALTFNGPNSNLKGIGVKHYANHVNQAGAVKLNASGSSAVDCEFAYNASVGCSARSNTTATNQAIRTCTAHHNGQMGLHGFHTNSLVVEGNWCHHNNTWSGGTGHFFTGPAHGGGKFSFAVDGIWRDNLFEDNKAHGLWLDQYSHNATIIRNHAFRNADAGLFYEYSDTGVIANNYTAGNAVGIQSLGQNVDVWNNTSDGDGEGINWYRGTRVASDTDGIFDPVTQSTVRVFNNVVVRASGTAFIWFKNFRAATSPDSTNPLRITADWNAYYKAGTATSGAPVLGIPPTGTSVNPTFYSQLSDAPSQYRLNSTQVNSYTGSALTVNTPGTTLPANVATALGISGAPKKGYLG